MSKAKDFVDPEKNISPPSSYQDVEHGTITDTRKHSLTGRKSSVAESIIAADLLDERYATTQRGLKSRHAQMIALGGTIGTG
jgi:amino acid permease